MTLAGRVFMASFPILVNLYAERYRLDDLAKAFPDDPPDLNLPVEETFDFIVAGGGTAGCVVSRRLSDAGFTVLLLEAGGDPPPIQSVPYLSERTDFLKAINFRFSSIPQKNAALYNNGILYGPAGKMLGGSSSHNDMIFERGNPLDFQLWAESTGDDSWRYNNILQYFKKSEKYMGLFPLTNQHNATGMMNVVSPKYAPGREIWLKAGQQRGFKVTDPNGPQTVGFSPMEYTTENGRRVSTYTAYIKPIEETQDKLTIRRYSYVSEVLFEGKTAIGVLYTRHGVPRVARARKEVILSTGAYVSPLILIKSGIGPKDQLEAANVTTVKILPGVGRNLLDHPFLELPPFFVDPAYAWNYDYNLTFQDFSDFVNDGYGPLTVAYGVAQTFYASSRAAKEQKRPEWPDIQLYYDYTGYKGKRNSVRCFVGLNRPRSPGGRVTLNTSATGMDDDHLAILDFRYFTDPSDLDVGVEGINLCYDVLEKTPAFKSIGLRASTRPNPHCKNKRFRSPEYWKCIIRFSVTSSYHASGTTKMGKESDRMAVVDSELRVFGVNRLRVIDASIFPSTINANICQTVIMVAEKASADLIREYKRNL